MISEYFIIICGYIVLLQPGAVDINNQLLAPGGTWGSWGKGSSGGSGAKPASGEQGKTIGLVSSDLLFAPVMPDVLCHASKPLNYPDGFEQVMPIFD